MIKTLHIANSDWLEEAVAFATESNLICIGNKNDIQWFGTNLSKALALKGKSEVSDIYGKLVNSFDDFCYQLCHSTPWGFEISISGNAVVDVLRGEASDNEKFFIWHDANYLMRKDRKLFIDLYEIMIERSLEKAQLGLNLKSVFLLPETEYAEIKKLLKHKEKYPLVIVEIVSFPDL